MGTYWDIWAKIDASRRGVAGTGGLNSNVPTEFANPYRSAGEAGIVPITTGAGDMRVNGVDATLLRKDPNENNRPLFSYGVGQYNEPYRNNLRNPYFRYQGLQKIGNMAGTQSNVFAVWITIGNFEVENGLIDAQHPDGYRLSQEIGADSGEIQRHRAFYIIDRSIPVCFEPGENHNVDRAVLLRRFIE
jgi:hypothetical protein